MALDRLRQSGSELRMKAVQISRFGGPEVLEIVSLPTPRPARGQVLVRVHAAGVNYFEVLMRSDRYAITPALPMRPGVEVSGIVEAAGEGVASGMLGTRVAVPMFAFGISSGGYAEYVAVDADSVLPLPDTLSFADAVALQVQGLTALHLSRLRSVTDKTVVVTAAAGGVGSLLVQLLKAAQARTVVALTSSQAKQELALSLGADYTVSYADSNWAATVHKALRGRSHCRSGRRRFDPILSSCTGARGRNRFCRAGAIRTQQRGSPRDARE